MHVPCQCNMSSEVDGQITYAGISENIKKGKAVGVEMCGEKLVLFRGKDGKVSCVLMRAMYCDALALLDLDNLLSKLFNQSSCRHL